MRPTLLLLLLMAVSCGDSPASPSCEGRNCDASGDASADALDADTGSADEGSADVPSDVAAETGDVSEGSDAPAEGVEEGSGGDLPDEVTDTPLPPLAWVIEPADGDRFVPLDVTVRVRFNQPMNALRFIPSNVELSPLHGAPIERLLTYDPATYTLSIAPPSSTELLRAVTPYDLRLAEYLGSVSGETLGEPVTTRFSTTGFPGRGFLLQLATAYAPTVYQQVEEFEVDTFARIDFDGDIDPTNNLTARAGANYGYVYYDVVESTTHYFISYLLYYPSAVPREGITFEHDFVSAQVVVEKLPDQPLGRLRAFATNYHDAFNIWLPDASFFGAIPQPTEGSESIEGRLAPSFLEDGRRVSIFVESGRHAVCLPNEGTSAGPCAPGDGETAPFEAGTQGLVYRGSEAGLREGDAADDALTYALRSFVEQFWALRDSTTGDDAIFGGEIRYTPPVGEAEEVRPGGGELFPTALNSAHVEGSLGDLPFTFSVTGEREMQGVWFVDPAFAMGEYLDFPETFSTEYCLNPYLGIDVRDTTEGCTPTTFVLGE